MLGQAVIVLLVKLLRAAASALTLAARPKLVRQLPWSYIRATIWRSWHTRIAAAGLVLSAACLVAGFVVSDLFGLAFLIAAVNLAVSLLAPNRL